jgi:cell wall hydrolase
MLVICVGREARGESYEAMLGVAYSIRNRVERPRWWGHDWMSVMSKPEQYTSMVPPNSRNDPNLRVYPDPSNSKWQLVIEAAEAAYWDIPGDNTHGADSYFDRSMDNDPPSWATDGSKDHVCDIGDLHFYRSP